MHTSESVAAFTTAIRAAYPAHGIRIQDDGTVVSIIWWDGPTVTNLREMAKVFFDDQAIVRYTRYTTIRVARMAANRLTNRLGIPPVLLERLVVDVPRIKWEEGRWTLEEYNALNDALRHEVRGQRGDVHETHDADEGIDDSPVHETRMEEPLWGHDAYQAGLLRLTQQLEDVGKAAVDYLFTAEHRMRHAPEELLHEAIAVLLTRSLRWSPEGVLNAVMNMLHDANLHTEAAVVYMWMQAQVLDGETNDGE